MNKLTVIIPFLNEEQEVVNTVKSIRDTAENNVDIILINDCSIDNFNYYETTKDYSVNYILNNHRMGVAKSRNIGVSLTKTPYFILLDAHMRFYDKTWWQTIIQHLDNNDRAVYSLICMSIDSEGNKIKESYGTGAYISLYGNEFNKILEPTWMGSLINQGLFEVPCVLGATYAMSKKYWDYIKGLDLLRYYGSDEAYLSLKVWFEGGKCFLISDTYSGHIFRKSNAPYKKYWADSFFNKLIISETLLPDDYNNYIHARLSSFSSKDYLLALAELSKIKPEILNLREYYNSIFTKDLTFFKQINSKFYSAETIPTIGIDIEKNIYENYQCILKSHPISTGFGIGGLGEIIFLTKYAIKYNKTLLPEIESLLEKIIENENAELKDYSLTTGICGLSIGLKSLGSIFSEYDEKMFDDAESDLLLVLDECIKRKNYSLLNGACSVGLFFLYQHNYNLNQLAPLINALAKDIDNIDSNFILEISYFLLKIYDKGYDCLQLIAHCTEILHSKENNNLFANSIKSYILFLASDALGNQYLKQKNKEILLEESKKLDPIKENITNIGLFNGSAGLVYIFDCMYKATGIQDFFIAKNYWINQTLFMIVSMRYTYGQLNENQKSLFYGISGASICIMDLSD